MSKQSKMSKLTQTDYKEIAKEILSLQEQKEAKKLLIQKKSDLIHDYTYVFSRPELEYGLREKKIIERLHPEFVKEIEALKKAMDTYIEALDNLKLHTRESLNELISKEPDILDLF